MAEAIISLLKEKLGSSLLEKFGSICTVNEEVNNLRSTFTAIQALLKDAEEQQWTSNTIRDWLDKLEDVAYEVWDILDEFATEDLRRRVEIGNSTTKKVRHFFTSSNPVTFQSQMSNKLREVMERLDLIARDKSNFNLRYEDVVDRHKEAGARVQTHSFIHESEVLGRKEDNDKLVHLLVNRGDEEENNVSIVPIVGMGGLGKTTLAKLVYNDERVSSYFDKLIWVFVSEKFDSAEIMRAIIESDQDQRCDVERMELLQSRLRKTLSGKRYLLVLDDVWNENQEAWLQLKSLLNVGEKGSKIIATTRSNIVANMMGTLPTHHLEGLPEEDCWSLFKQRAFPNRDEETYPDLVLIGREIVKKCKGVPLVAKVLGGLLHYKRSGRAWLSIRNNEIWELKEDQIMPTLRLSYNHLPPQLKQCFTYCILFHKGGTFKQQEVIQMWIAQGLIQSSEEGKLMEDFGAEYFDELCWRSFFQEEVMYYTPRHTEEGPEYKVHDHIYDLAKSVRRNECLTVKARRMECVLSGKTRHFSFASYKGRILLTDLMSFHNAQKLRTLILKNIRIEEHVILEDISRLTCLRVLILSSSNIKTLPNSIGKLKHLRFLDLSGTDIESLPESICTLWNLQTLKLLDCGNLRELPNNMWKMISLRHLEISRSSRLTEMPARISKLSDLQTLTLFIVSKENGIDELRDLNLRGSINIQNLQNVLYPSDVDKVGLREWHKLSSLGLSWKESHDSTSAENENCERVIESLQPHSNMQRLSIENYMGSRFPHWLMHLKVPNLIKISLISCKRCKILPPFSQLHHLKDLTMQHMPDLEKWSSDERSQTLPHIKRLEIRNCPKLSQMPHLPSVENLTLIGCNEMLLMFVRNYTAITVLRICGFPEMISLPEGLLKNLTLIKELDIEDCPKLKSLSNDVHDPSAIETLRLTNCGEVESLMEGVRNLTSLKHFNVVCCNQLTSLPDEGFQGLTSLQDLLIFFCDKLRSLGEGLQVQHLNSLACLGVYGCPELAALPESLYKITTLKTLELSGSPKLASLSEEIGNLASLKELRIEEFTHLLSLPASLYKLTTLKTLELSGLPELASLSEEIGNLASLEELWIRDCPHLLSLPASLQEVTTLQTLRIESCPSLERRCAKDNGEDWYKIAHVSVILINGQCLQERK
ncbi:putative disease resistance protein RGA3 [Cinnamomum micranthum f. kanehirae]|uniref:Putative disease resistance protein RGA3 n=1 Tax=Cinnamomum micranthum f. kanehirae TaxID=337451 RepID=A0A443N271_9MAGN|nr:putative disease resistance protein RGA3 [Cinnamomum micranthum f. kanehirae]